MKAMKREEERENQTLDNQLLKRIREPICPHRGQKDRVSVCLYQLYVPYISFEFPDEINK